MALVLPFQVAPCRETTPGHATNLSVAAAAFADRFAADLCPEGDLLLCCSRTSMDAATARRVRSLLQQDIDWDRLLRLAVPHRMVPLLYWHLQTLCPDAVPAPVLEWLQGGFRATAFQNLRLIQELIRLQGHFQQHGIVAIPWKGPLTLAIWIYGNVALRPATDLDLLIVESDILRAKDLMLALGYRIQTELKADGLPSQDNKYEFRFIHKDDESIAVELRWRLSRQHFLATLDHRQLVRACQPAAAFGGEVPRLPPEEHLLLLCMHGAKHCWSRLMWIADIAELVRAHPELNWRRVRAQARALGCGRVLSLGLFLPHTLLGAPLPGAVLREASADPVVRSLAAEVSERLFQEPRDPATLSEAEEDAEVQRRCLFDFRTTERPADRLLYRLIRARRRLAPTDKDRAVIKLPPTLHFLYYLVRPLRLSMQHTQDLFRRPRESDESPPPVPAD